MRFSVDILKAIADSSNPHWFSCRSSLSISRQTSLKYSRMSIFLAPPGCSAGYGTSAITCSTGASIASSDINSILGALVTRAGDYNKTDTVTVILIYSSRSSSPLCMRT